MGRFLKRVRNVYGKYPKGDVKMYERWLNRAWASRQERGDRADEGENRSSGFGGALLRKLAFRVFITDHSCA